MEDRVFFEGRTIRPAASAKVAENENTLMFVGKTESGSWFLYDENEEKVVSAILHDDPNADEGAFAKDLVDTGFAQVVIDHFPEIADEVVPEA